MVGRDSHLRLAPNAAMIAAIIASTAISGNDIELVPAGSVVAWYEAVPVEPLSKMNARASVARRVSLG